MGNHRLPFDIEAGWIGLGKSKSPWGIQFLNPTEAPGEDKNEFAGEYWFQFSVIVLFSIER